MRMVEKTSGRGRVEFIDERAAGNDCGLRDVRNAVHGIAQRNTMPVNGCALGEVVSYRQAQPLSLFCSDLRPRKLAVIQPLLEDTASGNFKLSWLQIQGKFAQLSA